MAAPPLQPRVLCRLELAALERVVRISAKPTKRLEEALQPILAKHGLSLEHVELHRVSSGGPRPGRGRHFGELSEYPIPGAADLSPQPGEKQPLDLGKLVSSVAAQRLVLDALPGKGTLVLGLDLLVWLRPRRKRV